MYLDGVFVIILFLIYIVLWKIKKAKQIKTTGINPEVMRNSTSNLQKYMYNITKILTLYAVIIIIMHILEVQFYSLFSRLELLDTLIFDVLGFAIGLIGLSLCFYAQQKMGKSWRVGIDEKIKTDLITTGIYKYIRNPTYLGLFMLNLGVWIIWSTWTIFIFNLVFVLFLEIQVRCEEDYLINVHGNDYMEYMKRTKRYIPFIY
ncbi:MAG TPA: isoprenylcysteine carboxylmethyltransferase family protein [Pseudobacteroides sp.]|nr:isoprenylcysteine carboxylmethyltransferase family protein [Pseudobacteroides sp.]